MHRIPKNLSGKELSRLLKPFGYTITRQTGSHIRLTSYQQHQEHHITIPNHDPIRIGTLNKILHDIAAYFKTSKEKLIEKLWG